MCVSRLKRGGGGGLGKKTSDGVNARVLTSVLSNFFFFSGQAHLDPEHRLMNDLFANYSKEVRPVIDKQQPIPVNFDMMFSQLVELVCDAKHMSLLSLKELFLRSIQMG